MSTFTRIRGFNDIFGSDANLWAYIESKAIEVFSTYGFSEIRLPIAEKTELFSRSIGATTDIVEKEMYTFADRRGDKLTLRPEGTAPAVRAYIENKLYNAPVTRLFYRGPMFRYERPQKGRYRQFYQIGAEVLADARAEVDAETMEMLVSLFRHLGLTEISLEINSLGCPECRPWYKKELIVFLRAVEYSLCDNCKRRIKENPLRALDCKNPSCTLATEDAPDIIQHLCPKCSEHLGGVKAQLSLMKISFKINPRMVRGLDYYTKTCFEITSTGLGAQNAIAAGGRYDSLVQELGGPQTPCFGFAFGMERLALLLKTLDNADSLVPLARLIYFISLGVETRERAIELINALRTGGVNVIADYAGESLKASMKKANRLNADYAVILGPDELKAHAVTIKDMASSNQQGVEFSRLCSYIKDLPMLKPAGKTA